MIFQRITEFTEFSALESGAGAKLEALPMNEKSQVEAMMRHTADRTFNEMMKEGRSPSPDFGIENQFAAQFHARMQCVLEFEDVEAWLRPRP